MGIKATIAQRGDAEFAVLVDRRPHSRIAAWRVVVIALLLGLLAFAPVARAVCDLQHVLQLAGGVSHDAEDGADPSSLPAEHDGCCDDGLASITSDVRLPSDVAVVALPVAHVGFNVVHGLDISREHREFARGRLALPPPEPVFKRVRKLLI